MRVESQMQAVKEPNKAMNLVQLLQRRAQTPGQIAAAHKVSGQWKEVTWGEVLASVKKLSSGLVALGLKPGERVAIFAATSLQWLIADLAISAAKGVTIPIYSSNTPDEARYILRHSEAAFAFVDSDAQDGKQSGRLSRIRQRISDCPSLRKVIVSEGSVANREMSLAEVNASGEAYERTHPNDFAQRVESISADEPWGFIYTSGTTGDPKGVILTHANWTYEAEGVSQIGLMLQEDTVFLFLPLAHSFAQVVKAAWLGSGFKLAVDGAVDKVVQHLAEVRPTVLPSVPRIFEKVYNGVLTNGTAGSGLKPALFRWALTQFDEYVEAKNQGKEYNPLSFKLARRLVFSKVRKALDAKLGGNLRLFVSGGAPLSKKIGYFFDLLGYRVLEGYGLTETSAGTTVNPPGWPKLEIGRAHV